MPKPQILIKYENEDQVYFPGQIVNGSVEMVLTETTKVRQIRLWISGKAHISWHQPKGTMHRDIDGRMHIAGYAKTYKDTETYMDNQVLLLYHKPSTLEENMDAGTYKFNFAINLPAHCTSSFESKNGHIRYLCKATVEIPRRVNCTAQGVISVVSLVDLNEVPQLECLQRVEKMQKLYGFMGLMKSGTIEHEMQVSRWGFVPGEVIPFEVRIGNKSDTTINSASVGLFQTVVTIADNYHTNCTSKMITKLERCDFTQKDLVWKDNLKVPPIAPCLTSRVLKIIYHLELKVNPKGMHFSETLKIPIFIGNVPIRSTIPQLDETFKHSNIFLSNHDSARDYANAPPLPLQANMYPGLPPPTYQEVLSDQKIKPNENEESFVPKYVYYDWK